MRLARWVRSFFHRPPSPKKAIERPIPIANHLPAAIAESERVRRRVDMVLDGSAGGNFVTDMITGGRESRPPITTHARQRPRGRTTQP